MNRFVSEYLIFKGPLRLLCLLISLGASPSLFAQQKPQYTQYLLNQYILNPAITGVENYTDVRLSYRHQWTGIDGAPVTSYLTVHKPFGKKDYRTTPTSFALQGSNSKVSRESGVARVARSHHGLGLQVVNDKAGALGNFSTTLTYAYHLGITATTNLAAGFGAGFSKYSLNTALLDFNSSSVDPVIYQTGYLNSSRFDLSAGLFLYSGRYYIGMSALQLMPSGLSFNSYSDLSLTSAVRVPQYYASGGYRFYLSDQLSLMPSALLKYIPSVPFQADVNCKLQYRDLIWVGAGYRSSDSFSAMLGISMLNAFNLSYSCDYTISPLKTSAGATHEIVLGYVIGNKFKSGCPSLVW